MSWLSKVMMMLMILMMFSTMKIHSRLPPTSHAKTVNYRMVEKKILDRILSPTIYDSQIRPKVCVVSSQSEYINKNKIICSPNSFVETAVFTENVASIEIEIELDEG